MAFSILLLLTSSERVHRTTHMNSPRNHPLQNAEDLESMKNPLVGKDRADKWRWRNSLTKWHNVCCRLSKDIVNHTTQNRRTGYKVFSILDCMHHLIDHIARSQQGKHSGIHTGKHSSINVIWADNCAMNSCLAFVVDLATQRLHQTDHSKFGGTIIVQVRSTHHASHRGYSNHTSSISNDYLYSPKVFTSPSWLARIPESSRNEMSCSHP